MPERGGGNRGKESLVGNKRSVVARVSLGAILCLTTGLLINGVPAAATNQTVRGPGVSSVFVIERYSPLGATANGPSGPATAMFTAGPHCCPSTAVVLTPGSVITDGDLQWMLLGLSWDNTLVERLTVCYSIDSVKEGQTYISQTRLTVMRTPDAAFVMVDDGTDQTALGPLCYDVGAGFLPEGTLTLHLRVVFGDPHDRIMIGMVALSGLSE